MNQYRSVNRDEKIRIAFLFQIASFWPSWESLYFHLCKDSRFDVRLYWVNDRVDQAAQLQTAKEFLQGQQIGFEDYTEDGFEGFHCHIALLQTPYDYTQREHHLYARRLKHRGIRVVYIPYGIEIADTKAARHNHFRESVVRNAWRIYTLSESFRQEYEKYCENAKAVRALGLPRFDILRKRERFMLPWELKERIGKRKLVVWHVHFTKKILTNDGFRQVTPYLEEYLGFAKNIMRYNEEMFFIFLPHPRFGDDRTDEKNNRISHRIRKILGNCENVFIDTEDDYRPSLLNADAIITDRSALAVEASVVSVPILYMKNPDYAEPLFPPLVSLFESYAQGTGMEDMHQFLHSILEGIQAVNYPMLSNMDDNAAKRIAEDIAQSVILEADRSPSRKLILFGMGFIYETMMRITRFPDDCEIVALADNDDRKWGLEINGHYVISPSKIMNLTFDKVIICAEGIYEEEIRKQLMFDLEVPEYKIESCDYLSVLGDEGINHEDE